MSVRLPALWRWRRRPHPAGLMLAASAVLAVSGTVAIHEATEPSPPRLSLPLDGRGDIILHLPDEPVSSSQAPTQPPSTPAPTATDAGGRLPTTLGSSTTTTFDSVPPSYSWERLIADDPIAATGPGSGLAGVVTVQGQGLVALGNAGGRPVVLVSRDASGWRRVPEGEASLGRAVLRDLLVADGTLLAVGSERGRPAAWSSFDARAWTPITVSTRPDGSGVGLLDGIAAASDGNVVAVGFEPGGLGVWRLDESGFSPVTPPHDATGGQTFADVASTSSGFVAGGNDEAGRPIVWTSPDGDVWHRSEVQDDGRPGSIAAIDRIDGSVVAVGYDDAGPKAWRTLDEGATWSVASGPAPTPARPQSLLAVTATPTGAVAAGQGDGGPLCWSTTDGQRWADCSAPDGVEVGMVRSLTSHGTRLVAVGSAAEPGYETGLGIWLIE